MYRTLVFFFAAVLLSGCASDVSTPTVPDQTAQPYFLSEAMAAEDYGGPYGLWGEWTFYFDESHENVDIVPLRNGRLHLNAVKFLEEYCQDCLEITNIHNNGNGTIDVTVEITHPFPNMPEYTGFDVKGIIMFDASKEFIANDTYPVYPFKVSWRLLGDPELLNADGYTYRWSPWYDSGSDLPIFNYWPGKYSNGTPTGNINGYLNFYSNEERHMFECNTKVSRTYHIDLPPGPVAAGYAVEACWEPPLVTPVTNPAEDFPVTANQPEPYHFKIVVNNGEPITGPYCCNIEPPYDVNELRVEFDLWYLPEPDEGPQDRFFVAMRESNESASFQSIYYDWECGGPPNWWFMDGDFYAYLLGPGTFKWLGIEMHYESGSPTPLYPAFTVYEMTIQE